mmetsp:Transcript_47632/g.101907  ORF Transcript_47632/g.101907 Transcript_47632/m.101907 type:complete len:664 (+) Transcript_47632:59-2050(+)
MAVRLDTPSSWYGIFSCCSRGTGTLLTTDDRLVFADSDGVRRCVDGGAGLSECAEDQVLGQRRSFAYVGEGLGGFSKVKEYSYVGEGAGSFDKVAETTQYGRRPRLCFIALLALLVVGGGFFLLTEPGQTSPGHSAPGQGVGDDRPYSCDADMGGAGGALAAAAGAAIIEAAWLEADSDHDGRLGRAELAEARLSSHVHRLLVHANAEASLEHSDFVAAVLRAAVSSEGGYGLVAMSSAAIVEAAWSVADVDEDDEVDENDLSAVLHHGLLPARALRMAFALDAEKDGRLDRVEFQSALVKVGTAGFSPSRGALRVVSTAIVEVAWVLADDDGDGRVGIKELSSLAQVGLTAQEMSLLLTADDDSDAVLGHGEFAEAMSRAGVSDDFAVAMKEAGAVGEASAPGAAAKAAAWTPEQRLWCCLHKGVGCTPTPLPKAAKDVKDEEDGKEKETTSASSGTSMTTILTTTRPAPAQVAKGCDTICHYLGKSATCKQRVQFAMQNRFLGTPNPCMSAHSVVQSQCKVCSVCSAAAVGCALPAWSTAPKPPSALPAAKVPAGAPDGCSVPCHLHGVTATCRRRVQFLSSHRFATVKDSCRKSLLTVMLECPNCKRCDMEMTGCVDVAPNTTKVFDCITELHQLETWSEAKRAWCCRNEGRACKTALIR